MAYKYYCTHCGRELDQEKIFFDMQPVLTGSTDKESAFEILKFYMTKNELEALFASGTTQEFGDIHCEITLQQLMQYISNGNNLNDPQIASLTMEEIRDYVTDIDLNEEEEPEQDTAASLFNASPFATITDDEEEEKKETVQEDKPVPAAIQALKRIATANIDDYYVDQRLKKDLTVLSRMFSDDGKYAFEMKKRTEKDNEGHDVLVGYQVNAGMPKHITIVDIRVCCYCGEHVFEHAGTAEHRSIAFIGDQKAGKTSTILALAHYAANAIKGANPDDPIWKGKKAVRSIEYMKLLSPTDRLLKDLANYGEGIAPEKTLANQRKDAYSATFRIRNDVQSKHYLLTLTDLPGELCNPDTGKIDGNNILNNFPVALACDAFVLCFDSTTAQGGQANRMVECVCEWANQFQELREQYNKSTGKDCEFYKQLHSKDEATGLFAPLMVVFTKCPDLEIPQEEIKEKTTGNRFDLIAASYMFAKEKKRIEANNVYSAVGKLIEKYASLQDAYHARLRCSPYGFPAPNSDDVKKNPSLNKNEDGTARCPVPHHIDDLMHWILEVSGCVPSSAAYHPDLDPTSTREYSPANNFVTRSQYRAVAPAGEGRDGDVQEALLRCYLFENPGRFDMDFLSHYDQRTMLMMDRLMAKIKSN